MRNVFVLYYSFFCENGENLKIGGIQTYIRYLCDVIKKRGDNPIVVQCSKINFKKQYSHFMVHGVNIGKEEDFLEKSKKLFEYVIQGIDKEKDIIIFATDSMIVPNDLKKTIAIQHGVAWDIPTRGSMNKYIKHFDVLNRARVARKRIINLEKVNNLVCVDYNYLNWYRTQVSYTTGNYSVIPNCVRVENEIFEKENSNEIKIIFARRFETIRGTELFARAIECIIKDKEYIKVTLAGDGPQKQYLIDTLDKYDNVDFITYRPEQSCEIHKKYDIAVIPTIGSEGTSLSLLEAMAAKCAVIATNVGGMTNIILSGYNGILINPEVDQLINALNDLINNKELRNRIGKNAYITVSEAFNFNIWEQRWNKVLDAVSNQ